MFLIDEYRYYIQWGSMLADIIGRKYGATEMYLKITIFVYIILCFAICTHGQQW